MEINLTALNKTIIAVGLSVVLVTSWIALRRNAPPLGLVRTPAQVVVDVQTLGEYPTTVTRIRLTDLNHSTVVWEITADDGRAQIHTLTLNAGENPAKIDADFGKYRVIIPERADHFSLRSGTKYRIELWGGRSVLTRDSAIFDLGS